jgi:arsenite methyltransferase
MPASNRAEEQTMSDTTDSVRESVRAHYASAARQVATGGDLHGLTVTSGCCSPAVPEDAAVSCCGPAATADAEASCCGPAAVDESVVFGATLYDDGSTSALPEAAVLASLGCGNPTAVADLRPGDTVLDLGSGGGIDVLLSARRVGPTGFAYGLDMTDEMLDLARQNAAAAEATNVEFLKGTIEEIPLPDASVDVVISNCVINLSTDKPAVMSEMFRVLRPGGRVGVSDVVAENHLTPAERARLGSHVGCIAGALSVEEYTAELGRAGFDQVSVTLTHEVAPGMHGAIVQAAKPAQPALPVHPL